MSFARLAAIAASAACLAAFAIDTDWKARYEAALAPRMELDLKTSDAMLAALAKDLETMLLVEMVKAKESAGIATVAYWLGSTYQQLRRERPAATQLGHAFELRLKLFGEDSLELVEVEERIGSMGDDKYVPCIYDHVLRVREEKLGNFSREAADTRRWYGHRLMMMKEFDEAEEHYERALLILETKLGPEHLETAETMSELGWSYAMRGDYEKALPLYRRALAITQKSAGEESARTAQAYERLGYIYDRTKRWDDAETVYLRALAIRDKVNGPTHQLTMIPVGRLADIYDVNNRWLDKMKMRRRLEAVYEK